MTAPSLAAIQYRLSVISADRHLEHVDEALSTLPALAERRREINRLRRRLAGFMLRLERDLALIAQPPSP